MNPATPPSPDGRPADITKSSRSDEKTGDDLQLEPESVEIRAKGSPDGVDIDDTWHRAGGKSPGDD